MGRYAKLYPSNTGDTKRCEFCNNVGYHPNDPNLTNTSGQVYCKYRDAFVLCHMVCNKYVPYIEIPGWDTYDESEWI